MSDCLHTRITTWNFDDGKPAGFWSCAECGRKFAPLNVKLEEEARMALDLITEAEGTRLWSDYADKVRQARDALREALGEKDE